jgi:hypothetical protein
MLTSSTKPRSRAWAAILALAMETSLSPAIRQGSGVFRGCSGAEKAFGGIGEIVDERQPPR